MDPSFAAADPLTPHIARYRDELSDGRTISSPRLAWMHPTARSSL